MRPLRFVALSEDGKHFVLAPDVPEAIDNGERFLLALDDRLRAAARGDISRLGQIELEIESQLRPREIQARIRAGETPDAVAAAAGIRIERIMAYAHPVLQERAVIAQRAQSARVKIEDTSAHPPTLLELIESRLLVRGLDDTPISWDARRLENGQWEVSSTWQNDDKTVTAHWRYDLQNGIVYPGTKDTVALVEPKPRLAAVPVPVEDPSLGEDAAPIPLKRERADQDDAPRRRPRPRPAADDLDQLFLPEEIDDAIDPGHLANAGRRPELRDDDIDEPVAFERPPASARPAGGAAQQPGNDEHSGRQKAPTGSNDQAAAQRRPASASSAPQDGPDDESAAKDKKPRIPSWDDIVFGVKKRK
ncbi:septation protein SepH [Blastococcus sp. Marseille-P5729]|uniref:septation protein SepH n=1 Tax=Blastococcus sp. Marseille-P5729 TaxID=2086582 RepID=UPI00131CEA56|nr:septation protein SepH [Blastococcus sp. Marseille-P5729]